MFKDSTDSLDIFQLINDPLGNVKLFFFHYTLSPVRPSKSVDNSKHFLLFK